MAARRLQLDEYRQRKRDVVHTAQVDAAAGELEFRRAVRPLRRERADAGAGIGILVLEASRRRRPARPVAARATGRHRGLEPEWRPLIVLFEDAERVRV